MTQDSKCQTSAKSSSSSVAKAMAIARIQHWIDHADQLSIDTSDDNRDIETCLKVLSAPESVAESFQNDALVSGNTPRFSNPEIIGSGAFGVIWRVQDLSLGQQVALKILRPSRAHSTEARLRFLGEAQAGLQLSHPGIARVLDSGTVDSLLYIEFEEVNGGNLAEWLQKNSDPLDLRDVARFVLKVADALNHAHLKAVLHRDIKPGNILLAPKRGSESQSLNDFDPVITDFGLAKQIAITPVDTLTQDGTLIGTAQYMSPEQAQGDWIAFNTTSEIFSLGIILYQLSTGVLPFNGDSGAAIRRAISEQNPIKPSQLRREIPSDLEAITLQCLQRSVSHRYQSMHQLQLDLERFIRGEPVLAAKPSWARTAMVAVRKHPVLSNLFGLALLLNLVAVIGLARAWRIADAAVQSEKKSNAKHFAMYVNFAEEALTGKRPIAEVFKDSVKANVAYELEQIEANRQNLRAWHRLSVMKHLLSLAYSHEGKPRETILERIEVYGILDRLIRSAAELNQRNLRYQRFYSINAAAIHLISHAAIGEQMHDQLLQNGLPTSPHEALRMAHTQISELCRDYPDDTDYQNALADVKLQMALHVAQGQERIQLYTEAEDISRKVWEKHREEPLFAKPILRCIVLKATEARQTNQIQQSLAYFRNADQFYDEAFAKAKQEAWAGIVYLQFSDPYISLLEQEQLIEELQSLNSKSIAIAQEVLKRNANDIEVRARLCYFFVVQYQLAQKQENNQAAEHALQELRKTYEGCADESHRQLCRTRIDAKYHNLLPRDSPGADKPD